MKSLIAIVVLSFGLVACTETADSKENSTAISKMDGEKLMEENCNSCHNTQGTDNMLAPPMHRVKDHYWDEETSKEEFIDAIVEWCKNPTEENSVMPGARRKFGLMPEQEFDSEEVAAIAEYLYDSSNEATSCSHENGNSGGCSDGEGCGAH